MRNMSCEMLPLRGRRIAVAASRLKLKSFQERLAQLGATVLPLPVIDLLPVADTRDLDAAIRRLEEFDWLIFTSCHGVRFFLERMRALGAAPVRAGRPAVCAIGPATARELAEARVSVRIVPESYNSEGVLEALVRFSGGTASMAGISVLIPRARGGRDLLPAALAAAGCIVADVPCYENRPVAVEPEDIRLLETAPPDVIVFTSPSAARSLLSQAERLGVECIPRATAVGALGALTAETLRKAGKSVSLLPTHNTMESMTDAILRFFRA